MIPEYTKLGKEVKDLFDLFYSKFVQQQQQKLLMYSNIQMFICILFFFCF